MVLFIRRQDRVILTGITKLATITFIVALAISLVNTIWAIYIDSLLTSLPTWRNPKYYIS